MSESIRRPAVAGSFYPADPEELRAMVVGFLGAAGSDQEPAKAMILPHAGLIYSGPIAATGYALLEPIRSAIRRVVLLGPAHRHYFVGLAAPTVDRFATPLGEIPLDRDAIDGIAALPQVKLLDEAHAYEHSLEVHLPFLQTQLEDFALVPLVIGEAGHDEVAEVIERLWGGPETLIVISSDLSHFEDYAAAQLHDRSTADRVEALHDEEIGPRDACGCVPIGGLLKVARRKRLHPVTLDLRNSGDTAGPRSEVVGYGAFALRD
jgi:AmmeMemoRadiSam system protein B